MSLMCNKGGEPLAQRREKRVEAQTLGYDIQQRRVEGVGETFAPMMRYFILASLGEGVPKGLWI